MPFVPFAAAQHDGEILVNASLVTHLCRKKVGEREFTQINFVGGGTVDIREEVQPALDELHAALGEWDCCCDGCDCEQEPSAEEWKADAEIADYRASWYKADAAKARESAEQFMKQAEVAKGRADALEKLLSGMWKLGRPVV